VRADDATSAAAVAPSQVAEFALDAELVALLDKVFVNAVPSARRLPRLLEERGVRRFARRGW